MTPDSPPPLQIQTAKRQNPLLIPLILACIAALFFGLSTLSLLKTKAKPSQNAKPMPVVVSFRPVLGYGGPVVAYVDNRSGRLLKLLAEFKSPSTGTTKSVEVVLGAGETIGIGPNQNWTIVPRDQLLLKHADYDALLLTAPSQAGVP